MIISSLLKMPTSLLLAGVLLTFNSVSSLPVAKWPRPTAAATRAGRSQPAAAGPYRLGAGAAPVTSPSAGVATPADTLNSFFGQSVAGVGDVNGDGYADAIIGAYGAAAFQGKAYLYLGSKAGLAPTPGRVLADPVASGHAYFGSSITGVGDVNGDGYGDVLIGAYGANGQRGKAYLYLGGRAGLSALPNAVLLDPAATSGDCFGSSIAKVEDVNGDGFADVLIGTKHDNAQPGQAYLYLGARTGLQSTPALVFQDPATGCGNNFGSCVAGAGDVNGDGCADLLIGSPNSAASQGRAYLYFGSRAGLSTAPASVLQAEGAVAGDLFGYHVAGAGDTNGDGYADVLIGAYGSAGYQGRAYVYLGSAAGLAKTAAATLVAPVPREGDQLGALVAGLGDLNKDGYADVLLGSNGANKLQGKAYVYLGSPGGVCAAPAFELSDPGAVEFDLFGNSGTALGDVNGDGAADVLVGAYGTDAGRGKAYVYLGAAGPATPPAARPAAFRAANEPAWHVAAYPNPYAAGLTAQLTTPEEGLATLTLADAAGRVVLHQQQAMIVGSQVLKLETAQALPAGHYTLLVRQNQHVGTVRLVHQ